MRETVLIGAVRKTGDPGVCVGGDADKPDFKVVAHF